MFAVRIQGIKAVRNSLIEETEMSPSQRVLYPDTLLIEAFVTNKLKQMEFALAVALMAILEKFCKATHSSAPHLELLRDI